MRIGKGLLDGILDHARRGYPFEVCGVLLGPGRSKGADGEVTVDKTVPAVNRETETPRVRYQIAPEDLIRIQREARDEGREIVGYYHSHPDHPARPSETDRRIAAEGLSDGVLHMVIGVEGGERAIPSAWVFRDARAGFDEEPLRAV